MPVFHDDTDFRNARLAQARLTGNRLRGQILGPITIPDPVELTASSLTDLDLSLTLTRSATVYYLIDNTTTWNGPTIRAGGGVDSGVLGSASSGTTVRTLSFPDVPTGDYRLHIAVMDGEGNYAVTAFDISLVQVIPVPAAFGPGDWSTSVVDHETLSVDISNLPENTTGISYVLDGGEPVATGDTTDFEITGLDSETSYSLQIIATNGGGSSGLSDTKQSTTTALPVPAAFNTNGWALNVVDHTTLEIEITGLPATATDIEYSIAGGEWVSSETTSTFEIDGFTAETLYSIQIRALNEFGPSAASTAKTATTDVAPADPEPVFSSVSYADGILSVTVSETVDLFGMVDDTAIQEGATIEAGGGLWSADLGAVTESGVINLDLTSVTEGVHFLHIAAKDSAGQYVTTHIELNFAEYVAIPDAFTTGQWTVDADGSSDSLDVTIASLPEGTTNVLFDVDGGAITSTGGVADFVIEGLDPETTYSIRLYAENSAGRSAASTAKNGTTDVAPAPIETTYTLSGHGSENVSDANADVTIGSGILQEGDLVIAIVAERSGVGTSGNNLSTTPGTWTKIVDHEQNIADGSSRHSMCAYMHVATSSDESGLTVLGSTGVGGTFRRLSVFSVRPSASKTWVLDDSAVTNSDTSDWNGLSSGTATAAVSDALVLGLAASRNDVSPNLPTSVTLTQNDAKAEYGNSDPNGMCHVVGILTDGQSAGDYSTTITSNGSGNEGIAACLIFGG